MPQNQNGAYPIDGTTTATKAQEFAAYDSLGPLTRAVLDTTRFRLSAVHVTKAAADEGLDLQDDDAKIAGIIDAQQKPLPGWSDKGLAK